MTLLLEAVRRLEEAFKTTISRALEEAEKLLAPPPPIPRRTLVKLLQRAKRNGSWPRLPQELKALLHAAVRARVKAYKSPQVIALLRRAWLLVELATTRGKAVVAALTHLLAHGTEQLSTLLARGLDALIALGIQLLNHPLLAKTPPT